jgi:hypothetical protein
MNRCPASDTIGAIPNRAGHAPQAEENTSREIKASKLPSLEGFEKLHKIKLESTRGAKQRYISSDRLFASRNQI